MESEDNSLRPDFRPDLDENPGDDEKRAKREAARYDLRGVENAATRRKLGGDSASGEANFKNSVVGKGDAGANRTRAIGEKAAQVAAAGGVTAKKSAFLKAAPAAAIGIGILIIGFIVAVFAVPMFIIGTIDYNLQKTVGFTGTVEILEQQAIQIVREMAKNGEVPDEFADAIAKTGVNLGQVTANGDFVRTNKYLANLDGAEVATIGSGFQRVGEDGELSILFEGELIAADDFPDKVNENPRLLLAFSDGADISARFYYSGGVDDAYKELKISRNNFNSWEPTGDYKKDTENFREMISKMLDMNPTIQTNGYNRAPVPTSDYTKQYSSASGNAHLVIQEMQETMRDNDFSRSQSELTGQVSQLLSLAVTSTEPYLAANSFMAIEEPIQRARIDGDGPINELMDMMTFGSEVEYTDVKNNQTLTSSTSILNTRNFQAATSESQFDANEALSFSRDRVLLLTGTGNSQIANPNYRSAEANKQPAQASEGNPKSNMTQQFYCELKYRWFEEEQQRRWERDISETDCRYADNTIYNAEVSIGQVLTNKNSDLFTSIIGGNRIVEGGAYISNLINQRTLGAVPSDSETVIAYNQTVSNLIARKAAAETAVRSPFDISSPNTFLGRIFHNLGAAAIQNSDIFLNGGSLIGATATVSSLASNSANKLLGTTSAADGDELYEVIGDPANCPTTNEIGAACNLYGNQHNTIYTGDMDKGLDWWKSNLQTKQVKGVIASLWESLLDMISHSDDETEPETVSDLDEDGKIKNDSGMAKFVNLSMSRDTTIGMDSGEVCEDWKDSSRSFIGNLVLRIGDVLDKIGAILTNGTNLYNACDNVYGYYNRLTTGTVGWIVSLLPKKVRNALLEDAEKAKYIPNGTAYSFTNNRSGMKEDVQKYSGYALYSTTRSLIEGSESPTTAYMREYYTAHPRDNSASGWLARVSGMSKGEAEMVLAYVDYLNEIANYRPGERYAFGRSNLEIVVPESKTRKIMDENEKKIALMALVTSGGSYRKTKGSGTTA